MDIFLITVLVVVLIALFRVQDAYKAHKKAKHPGDQPEEKGTGSIWFPGDVGGDSGGDSFDGGSADGGGGDSTSF